MSRSVWSVVAMLAPNRHTVSSGISPPSTFRPRACGWPYVIAMRDGPASSLASVEVHLNARRILFVPAVADAPRVEMHFDRREAAGGDAQGRLRRLCEDDGQ